MQFRMGIAISASLALLLSGCGAGSDQSKGPVITGEVVRCTDIKTTDNASKDLTLECLDGLIGTNVAAIKGPAIINVWGSWCKPCKEEMPYFAEFYETMDPNMQLIGVNVEE